ASGRMGSGIIKNIMNNDDMELVAAIEMPNTPLANQDIGEVIGIGKMGVAIVGAENLEDTLKTSKANVLVDFTIASAAIQTIKTAAKCKVNLVVGTTGFTDEQNNEIADIIAKEEVKAIITSNMSIGVNVFFKVLKDLAPILADYDIEIIEAHHNQKKDSPSGTAMTAFEIIADGLERNTEDTGVYGRQGIVGKRTKEEIGIHAVRGGDVVGDHTVMFLGDGERLEISHKASSRQVFITGVMKALRSIDAVENGKIATMADILGLN
ncbi:MAG: 4-hydroxy-tetrahydrodipicolinate reductase, partial [Methanobacteriaceae archaeon]